MTATSTPQTNVLIGRMRKNIDRAARAAPFLVQLFDVIFWPNFWPISRGNAHMVYMARKLALHITL